MIRMNGVRSGPNIPFPHSQQWELDILYHTETQSYLHESPQLTALGRWHGQVEATLIVTYNGQRKLTGNLRAFQTFRLKHFRVVPRVWQNSVVAKPTCEELLCHRAVPFVKGESGGGSDDLRGSSNSTAAFVVRVSVKHCKSIHHRKVVRCWHCCCRTVQNRLPLRKKQQEVYILPIDAPGQECCLSPLVVHTLLKHPESEGIQVWYPGARDDQMAAGYESGVRCVLLPSSTLHGHRHFVLP
ncbi:hypothetical protein Anapl_14407 [Anas platyrhynchos]|uniref:Uncharacterized protein n=1 Tax=Anas platyrhynchos TaxID=8839 RepID=R0JE73_ANAPL|nr:hypothetical protein Anapl_14407 [Anas platyrhynchos]